MTTQYVLGFLFGSGLTEVALICKERPDWQKGKLNGIGGHVEPGETPLQAMTREFFEETNVKVPHWKQFATLTDSYSPAKATWEISIFWATHEDAPVLFKMTDESPSWVCLEDLGRTFKSKPNILPNVKWLIEMALNDINQLDSCSLFTIVEERKRLAPDTDYDDLVITHRQIEQELVNIEQALAKQLGVAEARVRQVLIDSTRSNTIVEDDLVSKWHCAYSAYLVSIE